MGDCGPGPGSFKTRQVITVQKISWCSVQYKLPFLSLIGFFYITILKTIRIFIL